MYKRQILGRTGSLWHVVVCCSISSSLSAIASAFVQDLGGSGDQVTAALVLVIIVFIALFAAFKLLERFDIAAASPTRDDKPRTLGMGEQLRAVARSFSVNRGQVLQLAMITLAMIALRGSSNGGVWGDQRVNGSMFAGSLALLIALFLAVALVSFWAVSYTNLDVYKRQGLSRFVPRDANVLAFAAVLRIALACRIPIHALHGIRDSVLGVHALFVPVR